MSFSRHWRRDIASRLTPVAIRSGLVQISNYRSFDAALLGVAQPRWRAADRGMPTGDDLLGGYTMASTRLPFERYCDYGFRVFQSDVPTATIRAGIRDVIWVS
jgi:hypothetical protein